MNGRTSAQLFCAILLYIESMACRASFWFSCDQRRPAAASQLYFRTPGLDRNGVSQAVRRYQIPFRQELSQWSARSCPEVLRAHQIE